MAHVITTEIRDEGTFRWLILPTVEILHLSVFLFPSFPSKKTYLFTTYYHSEFYVITCSQSRRKVVTLQHWLTFRCTFARSHFSTCSALLKPVCQLFSVSIIGHFQKQVSGPSCSKVGYLDVPNQPTNRASCYQKARQGTKLESSLINFCLRC